MADLQSQLLPQYQNPTYPADANLTDAQIAAKMRARTLVRAQSPGELICQMDGTSRWLTPDHTHAYDEFMAWRHSHIDDEGHIIADGEPWINWEPYDVWADHAPEPEPIPGLAQPPPTGWQPIFATRLVGIPYVTDYLANNFRSYYYGIAVEIDKTQLFRRDLAAAIRFRVLIYGGMSDVFIGPRTNKPFVASSLKQVTFLGKTSINTASFGNVPMDFVSDPISGVDYRAGLHLAYFVVDSAFGRSTAAGWNTRYEGFGGYDPDLGTPTAGPIYKRAHYTSLLDKTSWNGGSGYDGHSYALFAVEGLFVSHPEAIPMQVYQRHSLGALDFAAPAPKLLA